MRCNELIALSLLTTPFVATTAHADEAAQTGFYVGADVGQTRIKASTALADAEGDVNTYHFDKQDTGYSMFGGFRFTPWLGVEGGYVDLGSPSDHQNLADLGSVDGKVEADGWQAFVVGTLPVGPVDLFAKFGGIESDIKFKVRDEAFAIDRSEDNSTGSFAYGGGVSYDLGRFTLAAQLVEYDTNKLDDLRLLSAGLTFHI